MLTLPLALEIVVGISGDTQHNTTLVLSVLIVSLFVYGK